MLAIVIISCLLAFLIFILGTAAYLLSVIIDDSDDDPAASTLGLDTDDFSRTPVTSPDELIDGSLTELNELRETGANCNCLKALESNQRRDKSDNEQQQQQRQHQQQQHQVDTSSATQPPEDPGDAEAEAQLMQSAALLAGAAVAITNPDDLQSAEMNSKLLKACESQREPAEPGAGTPASGRTGSEAAGISSWQSSAAAQKTIISGQLGNSVSKQVFDDFDSKEMQLGGTALHWCKTRRSLDRLIKLGLPLEIVNKRHETALHVAIRRHRLQILIGLLNQGANIESRNESGETPLILACKVNDIFAAQLLLIYDADVDAADNQGQSARHQSASICDKHKVQQQLPSAAHLILAMLNEIGAKRCAAANQPQQQHHQPQQQQQQQRQCSVPAAPPENSAAAPAPQHQQNGAGPAAKPRARSACTDGCAPSGAYNGNSYGRWLSFERESFNKRFMFADMIEAKRRELKTGKATRNSRLLCIDGGGLRGVIVCQIMIELEKYLKRPMLNYFDWVGGTSVGAFIACAMCLGKSLHEMRKVCFEFKDEVFSGPRPYNSKFLERALKRTVGPKTRLSAIKEHKITFATVLADRDPCQLKMFRNYKSVTQLLESRGLSADHYNNMSGQTTLTANGRRNTLNRISGQRNAARQSSSTTASTTTATATMTTTTTTARATKANAMTANKTAANDQKQVARDKSAVSEGSSASQNQVPRAETESDGSKDDATGSLDGLTKVADDPETTAAMATERAKKNELTLLKEVVDTILDENEHDPIVWQAVRASAAAPFFFKPYGPYLDGGIISNNPTLDILTEFTNYHQVRQYIRQHLKSSNSGESSADQRADLESSGKLDLVVSLGTGRGRVIGRQAMVDFGQIASGLAAIFSPVELVRSIRAARDLFKRLMQQSCHTDDHILDRAQAWCASTGVPYFRLNPPLATIFSIDDKRDEQLINALWQTKLYMLSMREQLVELAELLEGPSGGVQQANARIHRRGLYCLDKVE